MKSFKIEQKHGRDVKNNESVKESGLQKWKHINESTKTDSYVHSRKSCNKKFKNIKIILKITSTIETYIVTMVLTTIAKL